MFSNFNGPVERDDPNLPPPCQPNLPTLRSLLHCTPVESLLRLPLAMRERESQSVNLRRAILKASNSQLAFALRCASSSSSGVTSVSPSLSRRNSASSTQSSSSSSSSAAAISTAHLPICQQLASADDAYALRLATLNSFKQRSKASTRQHALKIEHVREHHALQTQGHSIERDLGSLLEVMALSHPGDEAVQSVFAEYFELSSARSSSSSEVTSQVEDIRGLLREAVRSTQGGGKAHGKVPVASAILGDMLVRIHDHFHAYLDQLNREAEMLYTQVTAAHTSLARSLQQERLLVQTDNFQSVIRPVEGDDAFVLLALEEWRDRLSKLDAGFAAEVDAIREERRRCNLGALAGSSGPIENGHAGPGDVIFGDAGAGSAVVASESVDAACWGGWPKSDHDAFAKCYSHATKTGLRRTQLLVQLSGLLPKYTTQQIESHEAWYRGCRALSEKKSAAVFAYESNRAGLVDQAGTALEVLRKQRQEERLRTQEAEASDRTRKALHAHLADLRACRDELEEKRRAEREAVEATLRNEADRAAALEGVERAAKKRQVESYQALRRGMREEWAADEVRRTEAEREERERAIEASRGNVAAREQTRLQKEAERRAREALAMQKEADKMEALLRLAAQVPYYDDIVNAASKLDHETAAYKAQLYVEHAPAARGFALLTGFTDQKIISDARFRLATALRDGGARLIQSDAARGAIASFHPRPHLAIHGVLSRTGGVI